MKESETVQQKERKNRKFETMKTKGFTKGLDWKGFGFGLNGGIKFIRSGLYGGDRARIDFIFISILNFKIGKNYFKIVGQIQKRRWKWYGR